MQNETGLKFEAKMIKKNIVPYSQERLMEV